MNKKWLMIAAKWAAMGLLTASNFFFYLVNGEMLNLILTVVILGYSAYEFFHVLSEKKIHMGIRVYLFSFYLLAVLSLFLGVRSLLSDKFGNAVISLLFIGGDIALILYIIHKVCQPKDL